MPIEFGCTQCGKQLRTPDETAGRQAKCPQCGAVMQIPGIASAAPQSAPPPASPFGEPPNSDAQGWNPYASPSIGGPSAAPSQSARIGDIVPTRVEFGRVFDVAWRIYRTQVGFGILVLLTLIGVSIVAMIPMALLGMTMFAAIGFPMAPGQGGMPMQMDAKMFAIGLAIQVYGWLYQTWLDLGILRCFINVARGEQAQIGDLFTGGKHLSRGLVVTGIFLAVGIVVSLPGLVTANEAVNAVFSIVGFVIHISLLLLFAQAMPLIVDKQLSATDALTMSMAVMRGNKLMAVLVCIVAFIAFSVFSVITCLIGLLFAVPFTYVLRAVFYMQAAGQPTADVGAPTP